MSKDALGGPGVAAASAPDPEHRPHSTFGALVQNGLDRAQGGVEHHPLAGVALVGWAGVHAEEGGRWGLSELTVLAHRSFSHSLLPLDTTTRQSMTLHVGDGRWSTAIARPQTQGPPYRALSPPARHGDYLLTMS